MSLYSGIVIWKACPAPVDAVRFCTSDTGVDYLVTPEGVLYRYLAASFDPWQTPEHIHPSLARELTRYVVVNVHTLCHFKPSQYEKSGVMGVLAGDPIKGGRNPLNGPVSVGPRDHVRSATEKDFERFSVQVPADFMAFEPE